MSFRALPSRQIFSTPVPVSSATLMMETYVSNSEFHSHLHPDALITPEGIKFSSNGGAIGGPVLQNLRRIAAGLRGEVLEPEDSPEPEDGDGVDMIGFGFGKKVAIKRKPEQDDDWQDPAEYELEQGPVDIEANWARNTAVRSGGVEPEVKSTLNALENSRKRKNQSEEDVNGETLDTKARKLAKKERRKQQKRDKHEARAKEVE